MIQCGRCLTVSSASVTSCIVLKKRRNQQQNKRKQKTDAFGIKTKAKAKAKASLVATSEHNERGHRHQGHHGRRDKPKPKPLLWQRGRRWGKTWAGWIVFLGRMQLLDILLSFRKDAASVSDSIFSLNKATTNTKAAPQPFLLPCCRE